MEGSREKGKKSSSSSSGSLILKTLKRCKSIGRAKKTQYDQVIDVSGVFGDNNQCPKRAKKGCFSVYIGQENQRFVIKAEYANHPLFLELLEEAETEFGFNCNGPLVLPCGVDLFCEVMLAIDGGGGAEDVVPRLLGCGFAKSYGGYRLLSAPKMITVDVGK